MQLDAISKKLGKSKPEESNDRDGKGKESEESKDREGITGGDMTLVRIGAVWAEHAFWKDRKGAEDQEVINAKCCTCGKQHQNGILFGVTIHLNESRNILHWSCEQCQGSCIHLKEGPEGPKGMWFFKDGKDKTQEASRVREKIPDKTKKSPKKGRIGTKKSKTGAIEMIDINKCQSADKSISQTKGLKTPNIARNVPTTSSRDSQGQESRRTEIPH